jgi:hypothetical protein
MDVNSQFFIKGIGDSLKEAGFSRDIKRGLKDYFKAFNKKDLKRVWRKIKRRPGLLLGGLTGGAIVGTPLFYGLNRLLKYYENRKKTKEGIKKEAKFTKDYTTALKGVVKMLVSPSEIKKSLKRVKRRPGYAIGMFLPAILASTGIVGLHLLAKHLRNKKSLRNNKGVNKTASVIRGIPDCTGPYGRGLGPGRGRADGTGLLLLQQPEVAETLEELINRREKEQEILKHLLNALKKNNK